MLKTRIRKSAKIRFNSKGYKDIEAGTSRKRRKSDEIERDANGRITDKAARDLGSGRLPGGVNIF